MLALRPLAGRAWIDFTVGRPEVVISFVSGSEGCSVVSISLEPHGLYSPRNSPGKDLLIIFLILKNFTKGIHYTYAFRWISSPFLYICIFVLLSVLNDIHSLSKYVSIIHWAPDTEKRSGQHRRPEGFTHSPEGNSGLSTRFQAPGSHGDTSVRPYSSLGIQEIWADSSKNMMC